MTDDQLYRFPLTRRAILQLAAASPCLLFAPLSFGEDVDPNLVEPTPDETARAIDAMFRTRADHVDQTRRDACATIQRSVDRLRASEFGEYFRSDAETAARWESERAVLRYLNESFDKALKEIAEERVSPNRVVFWHIYNMGYVVKTPTQAFAIDIKHRRAAELLPHIDFLLVTHKHGDHYTDAFCNAVAQAGKPVVASFIENDWTPTVEGRELKFGDCSIRTTQVDHNDTLIKFVTTYEINCGPDSGDCVIYHVGDACRVGQLTPREQVDVFIPHLAVGLDVPKAVNETIKPRITLLSHILELGHLIDKWRWSYQYGYNICEKCANDSVILPVWGEKYVYSR